MPARPAYIGSSLARPEGPAKVAGSALYTADLAVAGAWFGATLRSPIACGQILGIDLDPDFDWGRVVLVRAADIPGENLVALIRDDWPLLAEERIRHVAEPVLLLAAPTRELRDAALAAAHVRTAAEPACFDMLASEHVLHTVAIDKGDAAAALAGATHVVEGTWRTDSQEQMYIEPQAMLAWPMDDDGVVKVQGSLQCPFYVQRSLARVMGIEPGKARVIQAATGGGFGGKEDYPSVLAGHAALLARAAGAAVSMCYERHEDLIATPKRHPSIVTHRTGVDADGRLIAMDIEVLLDGGAYTTLSPVVLSRACIHAAGAYRCDNVRIRGRVVATNHVPYGAFRGFGAPQTCFAVERQMDRVAARLGVQPAELRLRNMLRRGDTTATSQRLSDSVGSEQVMARMLARSRFDQHDWRGAREDETRRARPGEAGRRVRRGVGFSFFFHGAGFTGAGEDLLSGQIEIDVSRSGQILVRSASTEFGQGTWAMFQAIVCETLGVEPREVVMQEPDTALVPDSGPTVASRTCMIVGGCLERACRILLERVQGSEGSQGAFSARAARFVSRAGDGRVRTTYSSPPGLAWDEERYRGDAYPTYGWAADVAEVEVDMDTFEVRVTRFLSTVDVGRALQPELVVGQIHGGSLQAIGFAHLELVTSAEGRVLQDRMATCIIPGTLDTPPMEVELVEVPFEHGPFGAKGVGELPMDGGAPAVASAIEDATGLIVDRLPATPERLLELWLARGEKVAT